MEDDCLAKERAWFKAQSEKSMDEIATRLAGLVSGWLAVPSSSSSSTSTLEDSNGAVAAAAAAPVAAKPTHLSVDEILAQARAPKKSVGESSSGPGTPSRSMKKEKKASEEEDRTISFRSADQMMHGFVVLQGHACVEAEVNIQFKNAHRGVSGSAELEIRSSRPWRLVQLQNAAQLVCRAVERLRSKKLPEALQELRLAQDQLTMPCSRMYPADPRVFHPRLPPDLLVEMCVLDKAFLYVQALLVRPMAMSKSGANTPMYLAKMKAGDVIVQGKQGFEVLEVCSVQCPLSTVSSVAAEIDKAFADLSEMQRNAKTLI
jgi:hypothetical protein